LPAANGAIVEETMTTDPTGTDSGGAPERHRAMRGERRVITALFCDVVNSTGLAENLDPEDWTEIMNGAFERLIAPIQRYDGTVAKLAGDAVLAFFGAPAAHEDDPQRAVLAALDMIAANQGYRDDVRKEYGIDFDVRIGINTGPVVVGDVGASRAMEYTAMGDAVNVAARMEQTAAPGTIQISGDTQRLVAPYFDLEALGGVEAKGKSEPVPAYRVLGRRDDSDPSRRADHVGAPLIGRDRELAKLRAALADLQNGRGGIITIIGEAGLGKSRLVAELYKEWVSAGRGDDGWDTAHGIPYDASRPFGLFQNFARQMFGIELDDPPDVIHNKVDTGLRAKGEGDEVVALCSVALERVIAAKVLHEAKDFPAEVVRKDIYDTVMPAWVAAARQGPRVMVVDDLQWVDPASIDLLIHLFKLAEELPLLFVCVFRPERQSPAWQVKIRGDTDYPHRYQEIRLDPLSPDDTDALISALLNIADLPADLRKLVLAKTDGNPYFVEEVVRSLIDQGVVERGTAGLKWKAGVLVSDIAIPDSIQALLMARIDRLDEQTKSTLQAASVIGRAFYFRILEAISDSAIALDQRINSLERVELLREAARMPELEYMFRHDLARDAAYGSILNRKRKEFHLRVAEAIEKLFPERLEEHAHRLAQHFSLAGDHERAMKYFAMAGEAAEGLHAISESAEYYSRALQAARALGADAAVITRLEAKSRDVPARG